MEKLCPLKTEPYANCDGDLCMWWIDGEKYLGCSIPLYCQALIEEINKK
jgi:hypothetical protein